MKKLRLIGITAAALPLHAAADKMTPAELVPPRGPFADLHGAEEGLLQGRGPRAQRGARRRPTARRRSISSRPRSASGRADRDYRHQQGRQSPNGSRYSTTRPATTPSSRRAPTSACPRIVGKKVAVPPADSHRCSGRVRRAQQARPGGGDAGQREAGSKQAIVASGDVDAAFDLYTSYAIWEKVLGKGNVGHLCGRTTACRSTATRTSSTPSSSRRIRS